MYNALSYIDTEKSLISSSLISTNFPGVVPGSKLCSWYKLVWVTIFWKNSTGAAFCAFLMTWIFKDFSLYLGTPSSELSWALCSVLWLLELNMVKFSESDCASSGLPDRFPAGDWGIDHGLSLAIETNRYSKWTQGLKKIHLPCHP